MILINCFFLSSGELIDLKLVHAVESVVIEWSHQIREVLKKDSAQPLLDGLDPLPAAELEFWKSKRAHLESISEQVQIKIFIFRKNLSFLLA
jgi:dynein heavy chain